MNNCSYGCKGVGVLICLRRVIVSSMLPYSCLRLSICSASSWLITEIYILRWMDQVEEDLNRLKIIGWRAKVEDRQEWNRIVEQTETHPGL